MDLCEFEASLIYRIAKAAQGDSVLKNQRGRGEGGRGGKEGEKKRDRTERMVRKRETQREVVVGERERRECEKRSCSLFMSSCLLIWKLQSPRR